NDAKTFVLSERLRYQGRVPHSTPQRILDCIVVCDTPNIPIPTLKDVPTIALRPVFWAALQSKGALARRLLTKHGIDKGPRASHGLSIYHAAVLGGSWELLDLFADDEAFGTRDKCRTDNYGDTPAHYAAAYDGFDYMDDSIPEKLLSLLPAANHAGETP